MKKDYKAPQFDTTYHLFNRGANRCDIFYEKKYYYFFLQKYIKGLVKNKIPISGWVASPIEILVSCKAFYDGADLRGIP